MTFQYQLFQNDENPGRCSERVSIESRLLREYESGQYQILEAPTEIKRITVHGGLTFLS